MINPELLKQAIKQGTPESLYNWILFTNHHHNSQHTPEVTIAKFKRALIGEDIDFGKLEELMKPKPVAAPAPEPASYIETETQARKVHLTLDHQQAGELFNLLEDHKDQHPELHELVYQAMQRELFSRINQGGC